MRDRVLIVDDAENVRVGFRLILDSQPDMTVVGEAASGSAGLELARHLRPDVVLADIRMPGIDGLELTRRLAGTGPRVIVVTTFDLDDYVTTALYAGACGFLLKRSGPALADSAAARLDVAARCECADATAMTRIRATRRRMPNGPRTGASWQAVQA